MSCDFQTPDKYGKYMIDLIPYHAITVLEPTPGDGNIVKLLQQERYIVTAPKNFFDITNVRFDAIVMNPPFTPMALGYKIFFDCLKMSNNVIALMPWLLFINSEKRAKYIMEYGLKSITHLPRSAFPGSRVQTAIFEMRKGWEEETVLKNFTPCT